MSLFQKRPLKPLIIAGPCMAESYELLEKVALSLHSLADTLAFDYVFKASFDKANRTSIQSYRGPGIPLAGSWFQKLKQRIPGLKILTDVHEVSQVRQGAEFVDVLQIPAFLCRQTDLIVAAVQTGLPVNVKKGQFLAPENAQHIISKVEAAAKQSQLPVDFAITERGVTFGYGNLVVDMRSFQIISELGAPVIFDVTHSLQLPAAGGAQGEISGGQRKFAPILARSAAATGYCDGFFIEVHEQPDLAKSDAATQLSLPQAEQLLRQILPVWHANRQAQVMDHSF